MTREIILNNETIIFFIAIASGLFLISLGIGFVLGNGRKSRKENEGEALVRRVLTNYCRHSTAHLMNNITLQYEGGTTQIDHLLITQNGILVIETKHYKGWLFAHESQKKWTQVIFNTKHRFQNPIFQNKKHVLAIQKLLDFLPGEQIKGLVVFTGDAEFKTGIPTGVVHIEQLLSYIDSVGLGSISENRLQFCVGRIECKRFEITSKTDVEHQAYLERKFGVTNL